MTTLPLRTAVISLLLCLTAGVFAAEEIKPGRLWLPPSSENLRGLLMAAAQRAMEHPDCGEVLYGRLNEYRSERGENAFTILCMRDARYTFNLVFNASELEEVDIDTEEEDSSANLQRLRSLLGDMPASVRSGNGDEEAATQETEIQNTAPPEIF